VLPFYICQFSAYALSASLEEENTEMGGTLNEEHTTVPSSVPAETPLGGIYSPSSVSLGRIAEGKKR
jgi:hypothetical protein